MFVITYGQKYADGGSLKFWDGRKAMQMYYDFFTRSLKYTRKICSYIKYYLLFIVYGWKLVTHSKGKSELTVVQEERAEENICKEETQSNRRLEFHDLCSTFHQILLH
jgi:hypothetical protein